MRPGTAWWSVVVLASVSAGGLGVVDTWSAKNAEAADAIKAFVPITPTRILDTRVPGNGGAFVHNATRTLQVAGTDAVPAGAVAVAMNVTVTQPSDAGFLTVWQSEASQPNTSNLNFETGETVPNLVTIGIGAAGDISIYDYLHGQTGTVHVIVDVVGWYQAGFNPIAPSRVMDTRLGLGGFKLGPGETRELVIQGAGNLPPTPIGAVALNVTAVNPTAGGYLTIWPTGHALPDASSVNFLPGEVSANAAISGVGAGGRISIFNFSGDTHVVVDVTGWFSVGYDALTPFRVLDTRQPGQVALAPGETRALNVVGVGGVPMDGVGAVALNVTATQGTENGFLTIWPDGRQMPNASSVNFTAGQTIPNAVVSGVGVNGKIAIHNPFGSVHVIVDITGWFAKSDSQAPVLVSLELLPSSVNTSASSQTITVRARITDDLAGNAGPGYSSSPSQISFRSPSGQAVSAILSGSQRISGDALDGMYEYVMTVPAFSESGTWTVQTMLLVDQVGNIDFMSLAELASAGFPTSFSQTGAGDTAPPVLQSLQLLPSSVDTSAGSQTITVRARITDNLAGNAGGSQIAFRSANSGQSVGAMLSASQLVSGDLLDGVYESVMTVPAFSESGTWTVQTMVLIDQAGNLDSMTAAELALAGLPSNFTQTGAGDTAPPVLQSLELLPSAVSTSLVSQTITVKARITDNLAGNAGAGYSSSPSQISFRSPSGQTVWAVFSDSQRVSGNALDGIYESVMTVPAFSESGTWTVQTMLLVDQVGNIDFMSLAELATAGFPTSFANN